MRAILIVAIIFTAMFSSSVVAQNHIRVTGDLGEVQLMRVDKNVNLFKIKGQADFGVTLEIYVDSAMMHLDFGGGQTKSFRLKQTRFIPIKALSDKNVVHVIHRAYEHGTRGAVDWFDTYISVMYDSFEDVQNTRIQWGEEEAFMFQTKGDPRTLENFHVVHAEELANSNTKKD